MMKLYEPFQHWLSGSNLWFYSDPHFDDPDCKLMNPDWVSVDEQIRRINSKVGRNDTIVFLGDIGNPEHLKRVRGRKVVVQGNHDNTSTTRYCDEFYSGALFIAPKIVLSHEPLPYLEFAVNLHGHEHGCESTPGHLNMVSDMNNWTPVGFKGLIKNGLVSHVKDIHRLYIDSRL